jgi:hypothetical protein
MKEPYNIPDIPKILNYNNTSPYRYKQINVVDSEGKIEYITTKDGNKIPKIVWVKVNKKGV